MTRLSWGRSSTERPRSRWRPMLIGAAVVVGLVASVDGFVHRSIIDAEVPATIQALLDQHLRTLERRDLFQYERTLDRQSVAHTRCMREFYDLGQARVDALRPMRLVAVEEASSTTPLVRAYVEERSGIATYYVRRVRSVTILTLPPFDIRTHFDTWYLTSPTDEELGSDRTRTHDGLVLEYREIDERISDLIAREMAEARDYARAFAPLLIDRQLGGRLTQPTDLPIRGLPCLTAGRYDSMDEEIVLHRHWLNARRDALADAARHTLRHEALHWVQRMAVPRRGRVDWALVEGWPEYVQDTSHVYALPPEYVCGGPPELPTYTDLQRGPTIVTPGPRALFLYRAARSFVGHLYRTGLDDSTYWTLLRRLDAGAAPDDAYREVLAVSPEALVSGWLERVRRQVC